MILILRGAYANQFELQNYAPIVKELDIHVVTSQHPLTDITLPTIPLWSPADLPNFPYKRQLLNRLISGEHWLFGLKNIITKGDVVHTAETYSPYTHQAVELRKRGIIKKLICTCWETIPHNNEKFARLKQWKQEAYKYVDLFHVPTQRAKQALITEGVHARKIKVIPYGVDLKRFKPSNLQGQALKVKRPLILTVARLEKEKGIEDLEKVARKLPQADFLVIGKGRYQFKGKNIETRAVPYDQIHTVYQRADLFFLPSRKTRTWEEQYGMALVEAMACGLPIVTTSCGAIPEVIGEAGIIVRERDVAGMTAALRHLLADTAARAQLAKLARARAQERYDASQAAHKLAQLYK